MANYVHNIKDGMMIGSMWDVCVLGWNVNYQHGKESRPNSENSEISPQLKE